MTDNYEFHKSSRSQDIDEFSPYEDKQYNSYINDLNGGVYTNSSLTLVQFDMGQIFNSNKFTNTEDLFLVLPITMVAAFSTAAAYVAPTTGNAALLCIKNNFINLIHQVDIQIAGKTIESTQPFINVAKNFQMINEMSLNDVKTIGPTLGFSDNGLDNHRSMVYTTAAGASLSGIGLTNNRAFILNAANGGGCDTQISMQATPNKLVTNSSLQQRIARYADTVNGTTNNIYPTILTSAQLAAEGHPYYTVLNTNYMVWYDYATIKLSTLLESLGNIGLIKKLDCTLRIWVNTGSLNVTVTTPNTTTLGYGAVSSTFSNTCPLSVNYLPDTSANGGIPAGTVNISCGLYIAKPPNTSLGSYNVNLGSSTSGASHPLQACRIYYSQIVLNPQKALKYITENRAKKVIYRSVLINQYNNTPKGGNFNQLINSGVCHPTGVLICPFISSVETGFGDYQWKNPYDSCPSTTSPISLTNLQVSIGGVNQLQSTLFYNYENYLEQLNLAEALTSSDFGVSTSLYGQLWWEMSRFYYVNVERSSRADKLQARNINISFTNNSSVAMDALVCIFYADELTIDVETGLITK